MRRLRDYNEDHFTSQSPTRLAWKALGIGVAVVLVLGVVGFGFAWLRAGSDVISPDNVRAQWQFAYDYTESLNAIGAQWCTAKAAEDEATGPDAKTQRTSQRIAIENNYRRVQAEYDGRLRDAFRARLVKPPDVPPRAPTLEQTTTVVC